MQEFQVQLVKDYGDIYAGSVFYVTKETKTHYEGNWPHSCGTSFVSVPKSYCKLPKECGHFGMCLCEINNILRETRGK